jgi:hypothetical protein
LLLCMQGTADKEAAFVPVYVKNVNARNFRRLNEALEGL